MFRTNRLSPCSWYNSWHSYTLHIKTGIPSYQDTHHRTWRKESSLTTLFFINQVEVTFKFLFSLFNIKCYQNWVTYNKWNESSHRAIYILTDKYGTKQSLQNPIRHLYLKLSDMWHLILEWIKKSHLPKAEYSCWFDTHIKILCFIVIWILIHVYAVPTNMSTTQPTWSIKIHYYMKVVLLIKLLFP